MIEKTRQLPHTLIKNITSKLVTKERNKTVNEICQVFFTSDKDSSKKLNPKSMFSWIDSLTGRQSPTTLIVSQLPNLEQSIYVLLNRHLYSLVRPYLPGHLFIQANCEQFFELKYAFWQSSQPTEYPHWYPVESKGAANSLGFPLEYAMNAITIDTTQNAMYKITKRRSLHFRSSAGPEDKVQSKGYPLYYGSCSRQVQRCSWRRPPCITINISQRYNIIWLPFLILFLMSSEKEFLEEIQSLLSDIRDPELHQTLGELNVIHENSVSIEYVKKTHNPLTLIKVSIKPTVPHCHLMPQIGLAIRLKLMNQLPEFQEKQKKGSLKVIIECDQGSHNNQQQINKQINDRERIAAAFENPTIYDFILNLTQ